MCGKLKPYVKNFENFLSNTEEGFTNNIPNDEKTSKDFLYTDKIRENDVEDIFADSDWQQNQGSMFCKKYGGTLFRQLPVCLFEGDKANNSKAVFTGKKSAIDLWSCNKGEINIFELKFDNKMKRGFKAAKQWCDSRGLLIRDNVVENKSSVSEMKLFTGLSDDGIPTEFIPDAPFREKAERKKRLEEAKQNGKTGDKPIDSGNNSGPGGGC